MKNFRVIEKLLSTRIFVLVLFMACAMFAVPVTAAAEAGKQVGKATLPSIEETKAIAELALIYGQPLVLNYSVLYEFAGDKSASQYKAPFNQIKKETPRVYTYKDTKLIMANSGMHTLALSLDLRAEPVVISVPAVEKERYYSIHMVDSNTYNYGYIGSRTTGSEAGNYLVAGPDWKGKTPEGISKVFQSSTPFGLTVLSTQLFNEDDIPNLVKIQAGYKAQPLSSFLRQTAPPAAPKADFFPVTIVGFMDDFFGTLDAALRYIPETARNKEVHAKLAKIGIGPGKTFDFKDLSDEHKAAALLGMKAGSEKVDARVVVDRGKDQNGWGFNGYGSLPGGDEAFYNGDWLKRAALAKVGIYANDAAEAIYPDTSKDSSGATLDTGKHNYTLTFPAGDLPPVNAFWSVSMYDGKSRLLIENPINRYFINSSMLPDMKTNEDGSLTIYIQKDSPGKGKESNWLPAPNATAYLVMRLYSPKPEAISMLPPRGQDSWQPPGIVKAK